jgi:DNA repair photolyase
VPFKTNAGNHGAPTKGRGATLNPEGRFEARSHEAFDDGWFQEPLEQKLETVVTEERVKSIISRNDSPDVPFSQSINPYRGCEHGCIYCMGGETPVLMADGTTRSLKDLRTGDEIYGTERIGWYRRYVKARVLAHWSSVKPAYRITLEDGTELVAGGDHRFLTQRGWKFVAEASDVSQRPHLTMSNKLMGTGRFSAPIAKDLDYKIGYLTGMIRGDGLLASYRYARPGRMNGDQHQFRLALCDIEALRRTHAYLGDWQISTEQYVFAKAAAGRRVMYAIRTHARSKVESIRGLVAWPTAASRTWMAGFLAGIFDAEGSYSQGLLSISNTDEKIIARVCSSLQAFGLTYSCGYVSRQQLKPIFVLRLKGGLKESLRFFHTVDPAITRKRDIAGQAVKGNAKLGVARIEPLVGAMRLYDITTDTEDFIANGVIAHNCYARPSHAYVNLSPGIDFETRLFAKVNAAEVLRTELARPSYRCELIALGANTDPYQPIERRYRITRAVIEVLAACRHPLGIVTKNAMVERDIDLLAPMASRNLVEVFISINNLDNDIARRLEPRCSAPARRLEAIRRLSAAGIPVGVLVAPTIPFLTDDQLERVLETAWEAGARRASYVLLRLPYEIKDLFRAWLDHHYPLKAAHVMSRVQAMRGGRDNDPAFGSRMRGSGEFAELLETRFRIACRRLGFNREERYAAMDTTLFRPPDPSGQLALF